jgi:hypothetical protein
MNSKEQNPAKQCPRFSGCNVNRCPLDLPYPNQPMEKDDKEKHCPMEKGVRLRIAAAQPGALKYAGRTVAEHAGWLNYNQKPLAVRVAMIERAKDALAKHRSPNERQNEQESLAALIPKIAA